MYIYTYVYMIDIHIRIFLCTNIFSRVFRNHLEAGMVQFPQLWQLWVSNYRKPFVL